MGCGCNKGRKVSSAPRHDVSGADTLSDVAVFEPVERHAMNEVELDSSVIRDEAQGNLSEKYTLSCGSCLVKHLCKAAVELMEFYEDPERLVELSMAIGDIGCAEDHAGELGNMVLREKLRDIRASVFESRSSVRAAVNSLRDAVLPIVRASVAETMPISIAHHQ